MTYATKFRQTTEHEEVKLEERSVLASYQALLRDTESIRQDIDDPLLRTLLARVRHNLSECLRMSGAMIHAQKAEHVARPALHTRCEPSLTDWLGHLEECLRFFKSMLRHIRPKNRLLRFSGELASLQILYDRLVELQRLKRL